MTRVVVAVWTGCWTKIVGIDDPTLGKFGAGGGWVGIWMTELLIEVVDAAIVVGRLAAVSA